MAIRYYFNIVHSLGISDKKCISFISYLSNSARTQTPTAGMEVLTNITPLTISIQELALRAYLRIKNYLPNWDNLGRANLRGHLHKTMQLATKLNIPLDNLDKIPLTFQPKNSLKLELTDFGSLPPPPDNSLLIYTDGSKTNEGIGAGFAVFQTDTTHNTFQLELIQSLRA